MPNVKCEEKLGHREIDSLDDQLDRRDIADFLSEKILNLDLNDSGYVIAVTGEWGSGKTFF